MANQITFLEAVEKFSNLATTGISISDAIKEAVQRIFEMGRYPGTTVELTLAEADFEEDAELGCHFLYFDEEIYDGAIGFRSSSRGWGIVDHTALYKDGLNSGDMEFVDYGTVDNGSLMTVSGTLTNGSDPVVFPVLQSLDSPFEDSTGTLYYTSNGSENAPEDGYYYICGILEEAGVFTGTLIRFERSSGSTVGFDSWVTEGYGSLDGVPDFEDWVLTAANPATGTPVISVETVKSRKYRAPLGFTPSQGPYYCLMKLEAPTLEDDTEIPVASIGALKCAIFAVCQEWVSDDERAMLNWQKFDQFMTRSERQVNGPKRWTIGMDSSLRRKPSQFS